MARTIVVAGENAPPAVTGDAALVAAYADVAGQLAAGTRRLYASDTQHFATWLTAHNVQLESLTRAGMIQYRQHLSDSYAKATAGRMLTVARRICREAVLRGVLAANPAEGVRGFKAGPNETPHRALTLPELRELLKTIDRSTGLGQRDYALLMLLARTGLRRSEAAALTVGDVTLEQGHHVVIVQHGKGDVRRAVKLTVDTWRAIDAYLAATQRQHAPAYAPLFIGFRKGDTVTDKGLSDKQIENIVKARARAMGVADLTPHGLRATYVTLALEGGAKLQQVQYAAGHADPRTTERYQKRKVNLDDHASDYIRL